MLYDVVHRNRGGGQIIGDTRPVSAEVAAQCTFTDIQVKDNHPFAGIGQTHGQIV